MCRIYRQLLSGFTDWMLVKFQTIRIKSESLSPKLCPSVRVSFEDYPKDALGCVGRHSAVRMAIVLPGARRRMHRRNWLKETRFMPHETTVAWKWCFDARYEEGKLHCTLHIAPVRAGQASGWKPQPVWKCDEQKNLSLPTSSLVTVSTEPSRNVAYTSMYLLTHSMPVKKMDCFSLHKQIP